MFDHLLRRTVRTAYGRERLDLREVVGWAEAEGVRFLLTETVRLESVNGLVGAAHEAYGPRVRPYELKKLVTRAEQDLRDLFESVEIVNPPVQPGAIGAAKQVFFHHQRDLGAKSSVPGANDLRILLQLASLGRESHIITRDGHFLAYADIIGSNWRVNVYDGRRLPLLMDEWRAAA